MSPIPYTRFILIPLLLNISLTATVAYSYFHLWGLGGYGEMFSLQLDFYFNLLNFKQLFPDSAHLASKLSLIANLIWPCLIVTLSSDHFHATANKLIALTNNINPLQLVWKCTVNNNCANNDNSVGETLLVNTFLGRISNCQKVEEATFKLC